MVERVGLIGRIGEALGPTYGEQRQRLALREDQRMTDLRDETELVNYLQSNDIIDARGDFLQTTNEDGIKVDSGFQNLFQKNKPQAIMVANATKSIGQFKTESGEVAQGKVADFIENEDGTVSLIMQRPDKKFAPKTWFSSEDNNDYVVKLSKGDFKDFMTTNYRVVDSRVKGNRGEAVSAGNLMDEYAGQIEQIDNDPELSMEQKQEAILQIQGLISPSVDKSAVENTELGLNKVQGTPTTTTPPTDTPPAISDKSNLRLADGSNSDAIDILEAAKAGEVSLGNNEIDTLFTAAQSGVSKRPLNDRTKGKVVVKQGELDSARREITINSNKLNQANQEIAEFENIKQQFLENPNSIGAASGPMAPGKKYSVKDGELRVFVGASGVSGVKRYQTISEYDETLANKKQNAQAKIKEGLEVAEKAIGASSENKRRDIQKQTGPIDTRISEIDNILNNDTLKAGYSQNALQELQTEKDNLLKQKEGLNTGLPQTEVKVTSDVETHTFTPLPEADASDEDFANWFTTNQTSLEKMGKDGDLVKKVKDIITKFDVNSVDDVQRIPFGSSSAFNIDAFTMANVMAGNSSVDRMGNVPDYGTTLQRNMIIFDAYGDKSRAADTFAMNAQKFKSDMQKAFREIDEEIRENYTEIVDLLYPIDDKGELQDRNTIFDRQVTPRILGALNDTKANPNSPKFARTKDGIVTISGGSAGGYEASKAIAGILFQNLVEANGSEDVKDWFKDVLFRSGESPDLGQILDRVRYTTFPNGQIDQIYYVNAQKSQLDGSINLSGLTNGFGQEGSYARNLLLAFIYEDKDGEKNITNK
tara:strand:- start:1820 stop:4276 length:2457 start_codon:yes stop_codon:yes gene_type:complete